MTFSDKESVVLLGFHMCVVRWIKDQRKGTILVNKILQNNFLLQNYHEVLENTLHSIKMLVQRQVEFYITLIAGYLTFSRLYISYNSYHILCIKTVLYSRPETLSPLKKLLSPLNCQWDQDVNFNKDFAKTKVHYFAWTGSAELAIFSLKIQHLWVLCGKKLVDYIGSHWRHDWCRPSLRQSVGYENLGKFLDPKLNLATSV